ncbi:MAG: DJ-1/PfpI family protein [Clostridia bacterium]|nr:DJ-1/PfpI family protein [Clostridia bacterium]
MHYLFLAEGFEEVEALTPLDLMRRAKIPVKTVGIGGRTVCGSHGIAVQADLTDKEFNDLRPESVLLPGGMPGTLNLDASPVVQSAISAALEADGHLFAICAAPTILGRRGLLKGKRATCYPGMEKDLTGAILTGERVVKDGNIITGAGMGVALDFGLAIVAELKGTETAEQLRRSVVAKPE